MAELTERGRKLIDDAMANDEPPPVDDSWGTLVSRLTEEAPLAAPAGVATASASSRRWIPIALVASCVVAVMLRWWWPRDAIEPAPPPVGAPEPPANVIAPVKPIAGAQAQPVLPPVEELLAEAEAALAAGDPDRAMTLLSSHAERAAIHPQAAQRMALRVLVLCAQGKHEQARDEGTAFLAGHGQSQWSDAVRRSCATGPIEQQP